MKYKLIPLIILFLTTIALSEDMTPQETANGCCGTMVVLPALYILITVAILVHVCRDSKNRGMGNSAAWAILIVITGIIGLIVYECSKTKGKLIKCHKCSNSRMEHSNQCPHCGSN